MKIINSDPSYKFKEPPLKETDTIGSGLKAALESDDFIVCIGNKAYFNFGPPERKKYSKRLKTNKHS